MRSYDLEVLMEDNRNESLDRKWEVIRSIRDALLQDTDWTQLDDSQVDKKVWAKYRQELRDLPQKYSTPGRVRLPIPPSLENKKG